LDGSPFPLGQLAQIEDTLGPGSIRREAGSRRIAVEATVHDSGDPAQSLGLLSTI
jgi:Cu/Ag efflux pump CusA